MFHAPAPDPRRDTGPILLRATHPLMRGAFAAAFALAFGALAGCTGPRTLKIDKEDFPRRPSIFPIEIYVGETNQPHREIAVIESSAYADDEEDTRERQIDELKTRARKMGADAVQEVRVLTKKVSGYTIDERTPFPSWKQGDYVLYFIRGTAVIFESSLPGAVAEGRGFGASAEPKIGRAHV